MHRTSGNGRSKTKAGYGGGIFAEHAFSEGAFGAEHDRQENGMPFHDEQYLAAADAEYDGIVEGVRPEHLLPETDQEALAIGRSVLGVAKALGGIARAAVSTGNAAVGDFNRLGLRAALARGLERVSKSIDPPRTPPTGEYPAAQPSSNGHRAHRWAGVDPPMPFGAFRPPPGHYDQERDISFVDPTEVDDAYLNAIAFAQRAQAQAARHWSPVQNLAEGLEHPWDRSRRPRRPRDVTAARVAKLVHESMCNRDDPEDFVEKIMSAGFPLTVLEDLCAKDDQEILTDIRDVEPHSAGVTPAGQRFVRDAMRLLRDEVNDENDEIYKIDDRDDDDDREPANDQAGDHTGFQSTSNVAGPTPIEEEDDEPSAEELFDPSADMDQANR